MVAPTVRRRSVRERSNPLPGIIDGHEWSVKDDVHGRTNVKDHEMYAPLDLDVCPDCGCDHAEAIRLHELTHITLSDMTPEQIAEAWSGDVGVRIQPQAVIDGFEFAVESKLDNDAFLGERDVPICQGDLERLVRNVVEKGNRKTAIGLMMGVTGHGEMYTVVQNLLNTMWVNVEDDARPGTYKRRRAKNVPHIQDAYDV